LFYLYLLNPDQPDFTLERKKKKKPLKNSMYFCIDAGLTLNALKDKIRKNT
jgi:hypothetical protein